MFLKQDTAVTFRMGPFLDSTDGNTEETALTIGAADVKISKNGGALAAKNDTTAPAHDANGWYSVTLNATDTNTLGSLDVYIHVTGALYVSKRFVVVPANVYDSLIAGSDKLEIDLVQWLGTAPLALTGQLVQAQANQLGTQAKADVNAEVVDGLATDTYSEPASVPSATSSLKDKIGWLFTLARNKITQTATQTAVRNDGDTASIATSSVSDDGTTFTRNKWA